MNPISKMTISFTTDEIAWLNWVITDVLKNSELAQHPAAKKITDAQKLFNDIQEVLEETGKKIAEEEDEAARD